MPLTHIAIVLPLNDAEEVRLELHCRLGLALFPPRPDRACISTS